MKILLGCLLLFAAGCSGLKSIQPETFLTGQWKIVNSDIISETAVLLSPGSTLSFGKNHVLTYTAQNGQKVTGKWYTQSQTEAYSPFQNQFSPYYRYTMGEYDYRRKVYFDNGKAYRQHRVFIQLPLTEAEKPGKVFFVLVPQGRNRIKMNLDPLDLAVLPLNADFYKLKRIRKNSPYTADIE